MVNLKAIVPIALSLVIAVVGSLLIYNWVEMRTAPKEVVKVQTEAVPVAVAASIIPWGSKIKPEMVKMVPYLRESLPSGYFSKVEDIKDRVLITPMRINDPIAEHHLAPLEVKTGGVAAVLKEGRRAVSVKGDKVIGLSGLVDPGNRVDVLVTIEDPQKKEDRTKLILENILVLATGTQIQKNEKGEPAPVDVYTLEVTPEEAERLSLAGSEGKLQLALRSVLDSETVLTKGVNVPQMLASLSPSNPPPPKQEEPKEAPKTLKKWAPRPAVSVEVIKGNEVSKKSF
jgi:pilus assembly protein CpaB